jgi:hypothetical protein
MKPTPDDIGDFEYKRRKEDQYLAITEAQEEEEHRQILQNVKANKKIVDSILDWIRKAA